MNVLGSECSGDCESGWTVYLEQSFLSPNGTCRDRGARFVGAKSGFCDYKGENGRKEDEEEEVEEEDLSMISDASSGPPHFHGDETYFNYDNGHFYPAIKDTALLNVGKTPKVKAHKHRKDQELASFLDDTASSPAFNFYKNNFALDNNQALMESALDYSQGFSATHFEGRAAIQDHFSYTQPSQSGNQLQNNQLRWF